MARHRRPARNAFTLIEVLIVIGVIVLLIAALVVGSHYAINTMKTRSARVTLESLRSATEAAETGGLFKQQPAGAYLTGASGASGTGWLAFYDSGTGALKVDSSTNRSPDFWRQPDTAQTPTVEAAPGPVLPEFSDTWSASDAVRNTGIALAMIHNVSGAATTLDALPATNLKIPVFFNAGTNYVKGTRVVYAGTASTGMLVYVAAHDLTSSPSNPAPTGGSDSNWTVSYGTVLDPWGNPMIFVPGSGLSKVTVGGSATTVKSPNGKPFWASAGPDGDFSRGDDNIYSFESN